MTGPINSPFWSERLCGCGHQERHHVAARLACPVVLFADDGSSDRCVCAKFSPERDGGCLVCDECDHDEGHDGPCDCGHEEHR